ncbi:MAG: FHA domain-containing protein, partial [Chloroflexi bacterium]|nr:FHA domain-containing protein [Chloroflexota bacterium]
MVRYIAENEEDYQTLQEPPAAAYLVLLVAGRPSHAFPLRGEVQVGRDKNNAIVVADHKVSRHHAILIPIDNTYILTDQGSANGTYLNGVQIAQPTRLKHNDRLTVGDTTFLFTIG